MHFTSIIALIAVAPLALAVNFTVAVGGNQTLTFSPNTVTGAAVGDTIVFQFQSKNHSVTQSSFAAPCTQNGLTSGFQAVNSTTQFPEYSFTMNATDPLWFFCAQTTPANHCQMGMVFAVNPTAAKNFTAFQATANGTSSSSSASPSGTGSSSGSAPSPSGSGSASGALNTRASAAGVLAAVGIAAGLFL